MTTSSLHIKLSQLQSELGTVAKKGRVNYRSTNYSYVQEADLIEALRPLLAKYKLSALVSVEPEYVVLGNYEADSSGSDGKPVRYTTAYVVVKLTITDGETGESVSTYSAGYGESTTAKALYIAITGATKYAYYKTFGIQTGDDPERYEEADFPAGSARGSTSNYSGYSTNTKATFLEKFSRGKQS